MFDTFVLHNASNVYEVTTFNGTVEIMARRRVRRRDLVYILETDYPGENVTARDLQLLEYFRTGFASNRCQVRYICSPQLQQRLRSNAASNETVEMASIINNPINGILLKRDIR